MAHRPKVKPSRFALLDLEREVFDWNSKNPVGTLVGYSSVIGERPKLWTRTRCEAYVLSGHTAVTFIDGVAGCVALDALTTELPQ